MSDQVEGTEVPEGVQPEYRDDVQGHRRAMVDGDDQLDARPEGALRRTADGADEDDTEGHALKVHGVSSANLGFEDDTEGHA